MKRIAVVLLVASVAFAAGTAEAAAPPLYKNCTNLNKRYPHGLGKLGARDKTSDAGDELQAQHEALPASRCRYNRGLDRDKDGIACEKL